jgi:hypothetical protein
VLRVPGEEPFQLGFGRFTVRGGVTEDELKLLGEPAAHDDVIVVQSHFPGRPGE